MKDGLKGEGPQGCSAYSGIPSRRSAGGGETKRTSGFAHP